MNDTSPDIPISLGKKKRTRNIIIAAGAATLLVAAAIITPITIQNSLKNEYVDLGQQSIILTTEAQVNENLSAAAQELTGAALPEVNALGKALTVWGKSSETAIAKDLAAQLAKAGKQITDGTADIAVESDGEAFKAALAKLTKDKNADPVSTYAYEWKVQDAASILEADAEKPRAAFVRDEMTRDKLDKLRTEVTQLEKSKQASQKDLDVAEQPLNQLVALTEDAKPAMVAAAASLPKQADKVAAAYPKADTKPVKDAAAQAGTIAADKKATVGQLRDALNTYFNAVRDAATSHEKAVNAEAAAAAAGWTPDSGTVEDWSADNGGGEWTDDSSGWNDWDDSDSGWTGGGGGGWTGGGSSGGGGGGSTGGGGSSGGGGSTGGGSNVTPESWYAANCPGGYNWNSTTGGYCYDEPEIPEW